MADKQKKRMAITTDFYQREVFDGIIELSRRQKKKVSRYVREILTDHYNKRRGALLKKED